MPRVTPQYLEDRRAHILDAAARCFAREGFHRATMQHIVREAKLSPGAIYRYFASKEDMVAAIASRRHADERRVLREASAADFPKALERLLGAFVGRLSKPSEREWRRITVQLWAEALRNDRVKEIIRDGLDEPLRILERLIRHAQREGRIARSVNPAAGARVAAALFQGLVLQQAWDPSIDVAAYQRAARAILETWIGPKRPSRS